MHAKIIFTVKTNYAISKTIYDFSWKNIFK